MSSCITSRSRQPQTPGRWSLPESGPRAVKSPAAPLLVPCLLLLAAAPALAQAGLGQPAPDFTLTASGGESYTLSDGFGRQVQLLHMIGYA